MAASRTFYIFACLTLSTTIYGFGDVKGNDVTESDGNVINGEASLLRRVEALELLVEGQGETVQHLQNTVTEQKLLVAQQHVRIARQENLIRELLRGGEPPKLNAALLESVNSEEDDFEHAPVGPWSDNHHHSIDKNNVDSNENSNNEKNNNSNNNPETILNLQQQDHGQENNLKHTKRTASSSPSSSEPQMTSQQDKRHHDVITRNDDPPRLQPVVDSMGLELSQLRAELAALKNTQLQETSALQGQLQTLKQTQAHISPSSSTYIQWGRANCSSPDSETVYSGVVGGGNSEHIGAGVNALCLSMDPVVSNRSLPSVTALLYGAEYMTYDETLRKDPVCAVCKNSFGSTLMIPGTNVCGNSGWRKQYSGYLMAGYEGHASGTEFICVDPVMESRIDGDAAVGGKLLFYVRAACGALPCQPYKQDKLVTCVVCSK